MREQRDQVIGELDHFDRRNRHRLVEIKEDANTGQRSIVTAEPAERAALADRVQALNNEMKRIVEQQASANPGFSTAAILDFLVRHSSHTSLHIWPAYHSPRSARARPSLRRS